MSPAARGFVMGFASALALATIAGACVLHVLFKLGNQPPARPGEVHHVPPYEAQQS